jgi:hypothetical protein
VTKPMIIAEYGAAIRKVEESWFGVVKLPYRPG